LEQLREQNRLLRAAAAFFGELSERLNEQLRRERTLRRAEQKAVAPGGAPSPLTASPDRRRA